MSKIYAFCGWAPFVRGLPSVPTLVASNLKNSGGQRPYEFVHDFEHVSAKYPENDEVYGLNGQHAKEESERSVDSDRFPVGKL